MGDEERVTDEDLQSALAEEEGEPENPDLESLGEEEAEESETEQTTGTEEKPEAEKAQPEETKGQEPDENRIPQSEFDRRYASWKQKEREYQEKVDLLKRDPEAYYQRFPDERPATQQAETPQRVPTFSECLNAPIADGQFKGYTLGQLWESEDAAHRAAAVDIYNNYARTVQSQIDERQAETKAEQDNYKQAAEKEHTEFYSARAQELFGKKPDDLSDAELQQISDLTTSLMDKFDELGVYKLEAAYKLATLDERIKTEKGDSVNAVIEAIRRGNRQSGPDLKRSTSSNGDIYERLSEASSDELARRLETLDETQVERFWKKAPKGFVQKHKAAASAWV